MSGFILVTSSDREAVRAEEIFNGGIVAAGVLMQQDTTLRLREEKIKLATMPGLNGIAPTFIADAAFGDWLLVAGQWFYSSKHRDPHDLLLRCRTGRLEEMALDLEGFFTMLYGHTARGEVSILTDIIGSYHCFHRQWQGVAAISNSSALLAAIDSVSLDPVACQEFIAAGVIYEDRTIHREVRKLGPSGISILREGELRYQKRYWQLSDISCESLGRPEAIDALANALSEAGKSIIAKYPRPICDLTGGYDSRALLAGMLSAGINPCTVVTGSKDCQDVRVSTGLANLIGLQHRHVTHDPVVDPIHLSTALSLTDGEYDVIEYSRVYNVHRGLSHEFDISINGSFGEVARGYWWELLFPNAGEAKEVDARKIARLRFAAGAGDGGLFRPEKRLHFVDHFADIIKRTNQGLESYPNTVQMDNLYLLMRMQRWQGRIASSTNRIWPCVSPFMFRSVLEIMLRTKSVLRRRGLFIRDFLTKMDMRLGNYPLEHGYPPLRVSIGTAYRFWPLVPVYLQKVAAKLRKKMGIAGSGYDYISSRTQLWRNDYVMEVLDPQKMKSAKLFDEQGLCCFLENSRGSAFVHEAQWARLLSLEMGLKKIDEVRSQLLSRKTARFPSHEQS